MSDLPTNDFFKDDVWCTECPGRINDHADYCEVPAKIETAKRATLESSTEEEEKE